MFRWAFPGALTPLAGLAALVVMAGCATVGHGGPGAASRPSLPPEEPPAGPVVTLAPIPAPGQPPPGLLAVSAKAKATGPEGGLAVAHEEETALEDDDDEGGGHGPGAAATSLASSLSDAEVERRFRHDPATLGSVSLGPASAGLLMNGVQMPSDERWQLTDPGRAWGTQETVDALVRCIRRVNQRFPGAPTLYVGHLSARNGGHLSPHKSHQSGRDADIGYYYKEGTRPFVHATEENLDLPRTWALVKAALTETSIDMIFIDRAVQRAIVEYAARSGEDPGFLDGAFQVRGKNAMAPIRHIKGHDNHIHFRFHNPAAEAMGQRVARFVTIPRAPAASASARPGAEAVGYAQIRAHTGDTLVILARRYGTTVEEIQRANGMAGNAIRAGVVYRIPQKQAPRPAPAKVAMRRSRPARKAGGKPGPSAP